jgi:diacylglycerol kinase (ATP)
MRYVFIVNPVAGKKDPYHTVFPVIQKFFEERHLEFTCHVTERPKHATELAASEGGKGDPVRIFGLGGDGTLSEVAAGVMGMKNAEVGIFPCGSGNDYVKTFGTAEDFLSPEKQLAAPSRLVDVIRSEQGFSMNLCTVGMDAKVPLAVEKLKKIPFLSGPAAYNLALLKVLLGKIGDDFQITIDEDKKFSGCFLMAVAGNGRYYGGGFCGAPEAVPDDGLLDFVLIRKPSLYLIPRLVKPYKEGRHLTAKVFDGILTFCRGKKMEIAASRPTAENLDGECRLVNRVTFEVVPHAVRFIDAGAAKA